MKLKSVRIKNFRSIKDETVEIDDYTCLVGANGAGKSNVLHALNIFFGETGVPGLNTHVLKEEDFHNKITSSPVEITLIFTDLSQAAQADLSHYVRQGDLEVSAKAEFSEDDGEARIKQYGIRLAIPDFAEYFERDKEKKSVSELKAIYNRLKNDYPDLTDAKTKPSMESALRSYEEEHFELCDKIPSKDEFYGVSKGKNHLKKIYPVGLYSGS